ncbi:sigma-54 dependent transcriptional regulator [Ferruginibacter lapsinanis]|uniref:sigma-54-dependent transcriptional regulator n=1 Tax=Ferruginibacter lapsinanis TaxID=563172 RepID=UPI001E2CFE11|nr:sigma-54 dependent transcriptional regulator [Ferruginibacter lapsinanis]UEG48667.1 sigma-54 dependent transcriptional regulator [Ferruginibacter lapsinanis]
MESYKIFIVEDDPWYGEILEYHLSLNPDFSISRFTTGKDCLANIHQNPDLITIDFSLPDFSGDKLYQKIQAVNDQIPVIVISGQEDIPVAVNLLKMGVADYLVKDDSTKDLLWNAVNKIRQTGSLKKEVEHLKEELGKKYSFDKSIKGQSAALQTIFALMDKAAKTNINVSITGETGTGKEVVAKAIHYNSERKKKNFVAVNMAAIPRELIESELFGHEKGAFTGAVARKSGKFEEANNGTIFLDEIAELDMSLQSKLLRVLQEREVIRVGGNEKVKLDIRLIVATHKNLADEVKKGAFREDLYYRIIGLPIELPPLRERGNDILILAKYFIEEFAKENKLENITLAQSAKDKLMRYNYPGNVRELKAITDLAVVMCNGKELTAEDISYPTVNADETFTAEEKTLRQYTCDIVKYYLKKYNNDVIVTADKLDIGKSTIYKMIQTGELV